MADSTQENKTDLKEAGNIIKTFWVDLIDLKKGVDKYATIEEIKNKKSMNGANAWMLMCSIMIASIGLNQNSQAVIIGAMLISPLMSPILGIGLAVAINDMDTLKKSLQHFAAAIMIAIVTSTIYFYLSPFDEVTSEIKSRTIPTFLDVLIAIFGGIAGIVSIARKDISTTLPGVAIATALMPPLCVCGFGIANGNWSFALNSFYLFFLNTFFVSLATYLIVRYLRFPYRKFVDQKVKRRNTFAVVFFAALILAPSIWIFTKVYEDYQQTYHVNQFIDDYIGEDKMFLDGYEYLKTSPKNKLVLKVYGNTISDAKMEYYKLGLKENDLINTDLEILSTSEIKLEKLVELETKIKGIESTTNSLNENVNNKGAQDSELQILLDEMSNHDKTKEDDMKVCDELKTLFPNIEEAYFSRAQGTRDTLYVKDLPFLALHWSSKIKEKDIIAEELKIAKFLKQRQALDTIKVIHY